MVSSLLAGIRFPSLINEGLDARGTDPNENADPPQRPGRKLIGMPAGFISEWWPASNRNGGRLHVGIPGRNKSESAFGALIGENQRHTARTPPLQSGAAWVCCCDKAIIAVRASGSVGLCPSCGTVSRRVHSRYRRHVTDLPLSGRIVQLLVMARRFRCDAVLCGRQIFTERFAEGVLAPSARRTARLDSIVHHLGLALGGRPAAGFAKRQMLPVSKDTLLRVVRRRSRPPSDPLSTTVAFYAGF